MAMRPEGDGFKLNTSYYNTVLAYGWQCPTIGKVTVHARQKVLPWGF